jgi:outer membrane protein assembly factor BamA
VKKCLSILLFLILLLPLCSKGQDYEIVFSDTQNTTLIKWLEKELQSKRKADTTENELTNKIYTKLIEKGFLESSVDSISRFANKTKLYIHLGNQYSGVNLNISNQEKIILSKTNASINDLNKKITSPQSIANFIEAILTFYENNGYPFANAKLENILNNNGHIRADLLVNKGKRISISEIVIYGDIKTSHAYIKRYIGIKEGDEYSEKKLSEISTRLDEILFLNLLKKPEVVFTQDETKLILVLEPQKANDFNGILGLQPDENTGDVTITGDIKLRLNGALGKGELFDLSWRRIQTQTQDLNILFNYPFLFNSPLGVDGKLQVYRRDTTFNTLSLSAAIQYLLTGDSYFEFFVSRDASRLISTSQYQNAIVLPPEADFNFNQLGVGFFKQKFNYKFNPRSGYMIQARAGFGEKSILRNAALENINYDTINLTSNQYKLSFHIQQYLPIAKRSTFKIAMNAAYLQNDLLFRNELFRIGGFRSLRGFDEEAIFASAYTIGTLEYRFLFEKNSFFQLFTDYAWYEQNLSNSYIRDTPFGFGVGFSFQTKAGIFALSYALGKAFNNPIQFQSGKIHFGFTNYF